MTFGYIGFYVGSNFNSIQHSTSSESSSNNSHNHVKKSATSKTSSRQQDKQSKSVQKQDTKALELGSIFSQSGQDYIEFLERDFIKQRISPGGTADLLSITLAMYLMENRDAKIKMF